MDEEGRKRRLKKILESMTRRMRRHIPLPPPKTPPEKILPAPLAPGPIPTQPSLEGTNCPQTNKTRYFYWPSLHKKNLNLPSAQASQTYLGRLRAVLKQRPTFALGFYATMTLILVLALSTLYGRWQLFEWLAISLDIDASSARPSWEARKTAPALAGSKATMEQGTPSTILFDHRLPLGAWKEPGLPPILAGILTPTEIQEKNLRELVAGLDPQRLEGSSDLRALAQSSVLLSGWQVGSPYGAAYDGQELTQTGKRSRTFRGAGPSIRKDPDFQTADPSQTRQWPKTARGEELAEASFDDLEDIEKDLENYAKNGKWTNLKKRAGAKPSMQNLNGRRLADSRAYIQLMETLKSSASCPPVCKIEPRVHSNRATYFGELYP